MASDVSIPPVRIAAEFPAACFSELGVEAVEMLRRAAESYAEDIMKDLRLGAVKVELQDASAENPSFAVAINGEKCRLPFRYLVGSSSLTDPAEFAWLLGRVIHENRELLVSAEIAQALREAWSSREQGLFLPELSRAEFIEYLRLLVQGCFHVLRKDVLRKEDWDVRPASANPSLGFDHGGQPSAETPWKCFEQAVGSLLNLQCILYRSPDVGHSATQREHSIKMLGEMQERLFFGLGIRFPFVQLAEDAKLSEREFRFQINDLRLPTECGLERSEFLVDVNPRILKGLGLAARPMRSPAAGAPAAVLSLDAAAPRVELFLSQTKAKGRTVLDREHYIIEACYRELCRHAGVFVVAQEVEHELDLLRPVSPQMVSSVEMRFGVPAIAQVLRKLVAEAVSVRDLQGVLETMLSIKETEHLDVGDKKAFYAYVDFLGPAQSGISAKAVGPVALAEAVRLALSDYIAYQCARGYESLPFYRIANDIEKTLSDGKTKGVTEEERLAIAKAVWERIRKASFPSSVVLTKSPVRRLLKGLIEIELPEVVVLSDEELPSSMKTQTLGQISFKPAE